MSKRIAVAAVLGLLLVVVAAATPAVSERASGDRRESFTLAELTADDVEVLIDVGEPGFSIGDYFVISEDPVFNASRTNSVGVINGDCLLVAFLGENIKVECDVTFDLRPGLITVEGPLVFSEQGLARPSDAAVTGGTGRFDGAGGTVHISQDDQGLVFEFNLIL